MSAVQWNQVTQAAQWSQQYGVSESKKSNPEMSGNTAWEKAKQALEQLESEKKENTPQHTAAQIEKQQVYQQYNSMMYPQQPQQQSFNYPPSNYYRGPAPPPPPPQRPPGPGPWRYNPRPGNFPSSPNGMPISPNGMYPQQSPHQRQWPSNNFRHEKQAPGAGGIRFNMPNRPVQQKNALYESGPRKKPRPPSPPPNIPPPQKKKPPPSSPSEDNQASAVGEWPPNLRRYVERAFNRLTTGEEKDSMEKALKDKITAAFNDKVAHTMDWDSEPLPNAGISQSPMKTMKPRWETNGNRATPNQGYIPIRPMSRNVRNKRPLSPPGFSRAYRPDSRSRSRSRSRSPSARRNRRRRRSSSNSDSDSSSGSSHASRSEYSRGRGGRGRGRGRLDFNKNLKQKNPIKQGKKGKKGKQGLKNREEFKFDVDTPDKKEKMQKRAARFEEHLTQKMTRKTKLVLDINTYSESSGDNLDWNGEAIIGKCRDLEKRYFRLTAAPDSSTVRPLEVLKKSLENVKMRWKAKQDYRWTCEQFKSIRQDLTVQCIRDKFTARVYETHARVAMEVNDHEEFNQCQTQLKLLYQDGIEGNRTEFVAYRILYYMFTSNTLDMTTALAWLTPQDKEDETVKHALCIRSAHSLNNFHKFFRLYQSAPKMSGYLIDWFKERVQKRALKALAKAVDGVPVVIVGLVVDQVLEFVDETVRFRPTLPVDLVQTELGFDDRDACYKFLDTFEVTYNPDRSTIDLKASLPKISQA